MVSLNSGNCKTHLAVTSTHIQFQITHRIPGSFMASPHDLPLLTLLATGLGISLVTGMVAARLRLPPLVGYLLAGIIVGPHTPGLEADLGIAEQLSEVGIVLLMFGVGLHFSVSDLMEVRRIAIPGAIVQIIAATAMGTALAHGWGWPLSTAMMFGLALSVASTVVLLRALEQHKILQTMNGHIAIGWLIVEDLAMVLALVLIPALATSAAESQGDFQLQTIAASFGVAIAKIAAFAIIMLVAGERLLPMVLSMVARTRSRELFTLAVFGSAVGIAYVAAALFGVSFALGAFFAGMMIRESDLNHQVAERALPFQDAFAVLFFVSVGMLFNPAVLIEQPGSVAAVVAIIIVGKSLAACLIILTLGYPLRTAFLVSAGLAQIGEFSFILIALGRSAELLPVEASDLILAGALISITLNPLVFHLLHGLHDFIAQHPKLSRRFNMGHEEMTALPDRARHILQDHIVIVGFGKVGREMEKLLKDDARPHVVIDLNRDTVRLLRDKGTQAIIGDAATGKPMLEANIEQAAALVIAVSDSFEARNIIECARVFNPDIHILVFAHNEDERSFYETLNIGLITTGPREIAHSMTRHLQKMEPQPSSPQAA